MDNIEALNKIEENERKLKFSHQQIMDIAGICLEGLADINTNCKQSNCVHCEKNKQILKVIADKIIEVSTKKCPH